MKFHVKNRHSKFLRLREGDAEIKEVQVSYKID
ncbi:unnamed protein product [Scytosiphon promiscuus]